MPVHFFNKSLDVHLSAVEVELLAVLCRLSAVSFALDHTSTGHILNLTLNELASVEFRGRRVVVIDVPLARALGGRNVRNSRAGFAHAENGLNLAVISVTNFVIISTTGRTTRSDRTRREERNGDRGSSSALDPIPEV